MKTFLFLAFMSFTSLAFAQTMKTDEPIRPFSHLSAALEVGTMGIGIQLATPINERFAIRAGYVFTPTFKPSATLNYSLNGAAGMNNIINDPLYKPVKDELIQKNLPTNISQLPTSTKAYGDVSLSNGKLLVDFFPIKEHSFHITAGLYIGNSGIVRANGGVPSVIAEVDAVLDKWEKQLGYSYDNTLTFGGTKFTPDELKNINLTGKVNSVKPYVGIGFGRPIPTKRIGVQFEVGAMFMGKAAIEGETAKITTAVNNELIARGDDKYLSYSTIYPMISVKLVGRIF